MSAEQSPRLLDQVRHALRAKHYSIRTEQAYVNWIKRFILFHHKRHPREMNSLEIEQFLTYLAVEQNVAAATQNQALAALLFLYQQVLRQPLDHSIDAVRAKKPVLLPVVMSKAEVERLIPSLPGRYQLIARLLYGSGLRLMECLRLRVKDVDFDQHQIIVRDGKGHKDRDTILPDTAYAPPSAASYATPKPFTTTTLRVAMVRFTCLTPWSANIPMPTGNGIGNTSFPPISCPKTPAPA